MMSTADGNVGQSASGRDGDGVSKEEAVEIARGASKDFIIPEDVIVSTERRDGDFIVAFQSPPRPNIPGKIFAGPDFITRVKVDGKTGKVLWRMGGR